VPSKATYPIGRVFLPVTFGTEENFRIEYLTFEVADFDSSYHAKFMAIPHHTYLIMKMSTPKGILSILGDIMVSYNCESATVKLSKDSAIKAAATDMVAQAAKIDQTTL
jgi:RNA-binding protein YlmH